MKKILLAICIFLNSMIFSSMLLASVVDDEKSGPVILMPQASRLTDDQLLEIGIKIWQNQCSIWDNPGNVTDSMNDGLTSWEDYHEPYEDHHALIGIGQYIWYPADQNKKLQEDWPQIAHALKDKGYPIEDWMLEHCPWNNSDEFFDDFYGDRLQSLRTLLAQKAFIIEQTRCIATRLDESLDKIKLAINTDNSIADKDKSALQKIISDHFFQVANDDYPRGLYALMDYVHFKGEGVLSTETIDGVGWGLRQALEQMDGDIMTEQGPIAAFSATAKKIYPDPDYDYAEKRYNTYLTFNPDKVQ